MTPLIRKHWLRLRTRFTVVVLVGVGLVSLVMAGLTYLRSSEALLDARKAQLSALAESMANRVSRQLSEVSTPARVMGTTLEVLHPQSQAQAIGLLRRQVIDSRQVFGMAIAYAPYAFDKSLEFFAPYVHRSESGLRNLNLVNPAYAYTRQDWYLIPSLLMRPVWAEPYFDEGGGNILMTTYSSPMVRDGKLLGIATADLDLQNLGELVHGLLVGKEGYAFLLTHQGSFLAAPKPEWVMRETIFSLAEAQERPALRDLGHRMVRGGSGIERILDLDGEGTVWLAFSPVKGPGWSLGVVATEDEVLAPIYALARQQMMWGVAGMITLILVVFGLVVGLTRPLQRVLNASRRLAQGDLTAQVSDVPPGDEIGDLAATFNNMVRELNRYVTELTATTKEKARIQSELDLARQIQQSVLPRIYPPFPDRMEFDLFARTLPAREVGGDFYDFFFVDKDHLGLVVADVSGKGVPAALFMTVTRTLIKNSSIHHPDPVCSLSEVNSEIVPDNEMCMFVTVFYGVYELSTGILRFVSAGHPSPLLRRADGSTEQLPKLRGMALGIMDDLNLEVGEVQLEIGDSLLAFTDGLDEAVNSQDEMFGIERAAQWLSRTQPVSAPVLLDGLIDYWKQFTGDLDQFDDLTLLTFRRRQ
ncbi:MAG: SpoIIE family protein phosphatase [Desulfarculus sp.]|nr:SpoIIE family protein phosphatase [Desulfarculus sp.]